MVLIDDIVKDLIKEHHSYLSACERNLTEINRETAILIAKSKVLQANRELASEYFKHKIAERERLFKLATAVLDYAITTGNVELADISIDSISIMSRTSPFNF